MHGPVGEIKPDDLVVIQSGPGKPRQGSQVNMNIVIGIVPGQKAWQHARVGRVHIAADHRQAYSGHGMHAKLLEHGDMAMSTANEDQIFDNGRLLPLHICLSEHGYPRLGRAHHIGAMIEL